MMFPADAWAYLDPGTGSLMIQTVIATLAAIGYGLRAYWSPRLWLQRIGNRNTSSADPSPEDPSDGSA